MQTERMWQQQTEPEQWVSTKTSEKAFSVDVSKATGSRYSVLGFDAGGKKISGFRLADRRNICTWKRRGKLQTVILVQ